MRTITELEHVDWQQVPWEELNPLLRRQFVSMEPMTIARFRLAKGCFIPEHHHLNSQVTNVLEGALKFGIKGREVVVSSGESLCIPPEVAHSALALEETFVIDVFCPPRADWAEQQDGYLRGAQK